jgi:hypothetical protein
MLTIYLNETIKTEEVIALINTAIENESIITWKKDSDGDYTASSSQWSMQAWMHPYVDDNIIKFGIISRRNVKLSSIVYAIYHSSFSEMLLIHFDKYIKKIEISSLLVKGIDIFD